MRKLLFSISLVILGLTTVMGQKLQYGLRTGLGFASQSIDNPDIVSTNSVTEYYLSGYVDIPFKKIFIEPGLEVLGKGVKQYQNAQTNTRTLTYLEIPITALYKFNLNTLGKIYVGAGPYVAIGLSGNDQLEGVNTVSGSNISFGDDQDYKKTDWGVNFATGLEFNNHLTFNIKYSLELNNIATANGDTNTTSIKNRIFTIGLGFWF